MKDFWWVRELALILLERPITLPFVRRHQSIELFWRYQVTRVMHAQLSEDIPLKVLLQGLVTDFFDHTAYPIRTCSVMPPLTGLKNQRHYSVWRKGPQAQI